MTEILVGVDGTDTPADPLHLAGHLARVMGARLTLVQAFAPDWPRGVAGATEWNELLRAQAGAELQRAAQRLEGVEGVEGVERIAVAARSGARGLHELAVDRGADMIVVGFTHTASLGRVAPGATAERLLHGAPCAVAVAPRGFVARDPARWGELAVAWVDGPEASAALAFAARLAPALGSRLRVVHALEAPEYPDPEGLPTIAYPGLLEGLRRTARRSFDGVAASVRPGVDYESRLLEDEPVRALVAESESVDLLICGSRGYGPLRSVIVGGVSGRLVREAASPVIVVPRGAQDPPAVLADLREVDAVTV